MQSCTYALQTYLFHMTSCFVPHSSFKELLDDPYSDLKSFADSALSEQDSSDGEKVIISDDFNKLLSFLKYVHVHQVLHHKHVAKTQRAALVVLILFFLG